MRVLESATLLNLIVLSAGTLYRWESTESKIKVAYDVNWNHVCSILCHCCVEFDQALPEE